METILQRPCANHPLREAAARCPACGSVYCRECVTEHEDRVLCAACLRKEGRGHASSAASRLARMVRALAPFLGLVVAWLFFYSLGRGLLLLPPEYPEDSRSPSPKASP